ncbi:hypothetical protein HMPREF3196_00735 [Bifidobacterium bifidum]|uniref:Uncharacterized protein n=1 Tax=Bifidobacterium bifidum TaxID=1681 RepID=A0A133KRJ2_BIFBI|nr:hypothetical protein HMPREF3196_00735 [Bifidobacterium bifidum]
MAPVADRPSDERAATCCPPTPSMPLTGLMGVYVPSSDDSSNYDNHRRNAD